jgi:hypothetical protein
MNKGLEGSLERTWKTIMGKLHITWSTNAFTTIGQKFHQNFQSRMQVQPLNYRGWSLAKQHKFKGWQDNMQGLDNKVKRYIVTHL